MLVTNSKQMRDIDFFATNNLLIPSIILMENAAIGVLKHCPPAKNARVFCGKGNNGGDGFALARHLHLKGITTEVVILDDNLFGDALLNFEIIKKMGIKYTSFNECDKNEGFDLIVDALLGTGLKGEVKPIVAEIINYINSCSGFKLSIDIPSGVDADTGQATTAVMADRTISLHLPKIGVLQHPGAVFAGELIVVDISIPNNILETKTYLLDKAFARSLLPPRGAACHKGNFGHVATVCGSRGMVGAAYLCTQAAVRGGSGLVTAFVPECIITPLSAKLTEAMIAPIDNFSAKDAVVVGCGLRDSHDIVEKIIKLSSKVVIDADGINAICNNIDILKGTVITPHPGEMARLTKTSVAEVQADRVSFARNFAVQNGCTVVLKGAMTVIAGCDGSVYINPTGNSGMATGGSGDVLAGLLASFLGQGLDDVSASCLAVYVHGLAGDLCAQRIGKHGMAAGDILKAIPKAIAALGKD